MDALDYVLPAAAELLRRVDAVLGQTGAPAGHPVLELLRELGALPGDAVGAVAALRPGPLATVRDQLRPLVQAYGSAAAAAGGQVAWSGPAAQAYAHRAGALASQLGDGGSSRLIDTVAFAEALAAWMVTARTTLARTLAQVLASAEAVSLTVISADWLPPEARLAAADIGAEVLGVIAAAYDDAQRLDGAWGRRVAYSRFVGPCGVGLPTGPDGVSLGG